MNNTNQYLYINKSLTSLPISTILIYLVLPFHARLLETSYTFTYTTKTTTTTRAIMPYLGLQCCILTLYQLVSSYSASLASLPPA